MNATVHPNGNHSHLHRLHHPTKAFPWTSSRSTTTITNLHIRANPLHLPTRPAHIVAAGARGFGVAEEGDAGKKRGRISNNKGEDDGGDDDDAIPTAVFDRMMRRILWFVGTPMATGVGLLYVMGFLQEQRLWDVPKWLPFATTLVLFGTSALGIAYGTLSSSWDPERTGSLLGWEEAQRNWPELWKEEEEEDMR